MKIVKQHITIFTVMSRFEFDYTVCSFTIVEIWKTHCRENLCW